MACPKCGCKTTYPYDTGGDDSFDRYMGYDQWERCAACGEVFAVEDHAEEDDDD